MQTLQVRHFELFIDRKLEFSEILPNPKSFGFDKVRIWQYLLLYLHQSPQ